MMRTLLCLFAVAAAQAGYYFWRLRPDYFRWESLTGIALATLTIVFWSAVLQIAWRDKSERPGSPRDEPDSPSGFEKKRMVIAGVFAFLAIPTMIGGVVWANYFGSKDFQRFELLSVWFPGRLQALHPHLRDAIPAIELQRFPISQTARWDDLAIQEDERELRRRELESSLVSKVQEIDTATLIDKIRSGDEAAVQALIDSGINLNVPDPDSGLRPLDEASRCGDPAILEMLKQSGARRSPDA